LDTRYLLASLLLAHVSEMWLITWLVMRQLQRFRVFRTSPVWTLLLVVPELDN